MFFCGEEVEGVVLAPARTVKGATVVALIVRGAKRRELPTADASPHEVVLAPARTVKR